MKKVVYASLLLATSAVVTSVNAEDLDPRLYTNLPIDQNFLGAAYLYIDGDVYTSAAIPVEDFTLEIDSQAIAYARTFSMYGNSAKFDIITAHMCGKGEALLNGEPAEREYCGMADTRFRLNYNFYNAPAMEIAEYIKAPKKIVAGVSFQVSAPTGKYDKQFIFNPGSNRWFFKPEVGVSIPHGNWEVDFSFGMKFFTDNTDYQRFKRFEQDPIFNLQMHIVYDIKPGQWIAFNSNYFGGGDTFVDGEKTGVKDENFRAGVTYSMSLSHNQSLKFSLNTGVTTRFGNDSDAYAIGYTYRW
ncbi:transporter [Thalassotalea euphylliae]|uniref:transporter n=1 Tax=Thalassotalea euphylliae TaxID=1655234 RepID=UPI00363D0A50